MRMDGWDTVFPLLTLQWVFPTYRFPSHPAARERECLWKQGTHGCWGGL